MWTGRFRTVVQELRRPTRTILIASHNLDELERLADRVVILHRGQVQRIVGPGSGAHASDSRICYRLKLAAPHVTLNQLLPDARPVDGRPGEWRVQGDLTALNGALSALIGSGAVVVSFAPEESRLESEFRLALGSHR